MSDWVAGWIAALPLSSPSQSIAVALITTKTSSILSLQFRCLKLFLFEERDIYSSILGHSLNNYHSFNCCGSITNPLPVLDGEIADPPPCPASLPEWASAPTRNHQVGCSLSQTGHHCRTNDSYTFISPCQASHYKRWLFLAGVCLCSQTNLSEHVLCGGLLDLHCLGSNPHSFGFSLPQFPSL